MSDFREIEALVAAHQKINAIKALRERTGVGLKEAKDAVEHFEAHGRWPDAYAHAAQAAVATKPASSQSPRSASPLQPLEELLARNEIIGAIKELRTLGYGGLKECKDAVDEYRAHGRWAGSLVAWAEQLPASSVHSPVHAPVPAPAPTPTHAPAPAPADASQGSRSSALRSALANHLGHAPDVLLVVRARRSSRDGDLAMLRERACFVHDDRRSEIEPDIPYEAVRQVVVFTGAPSVLCVDLDHVRERFELDEADAEAALALFRAFAP
jgi:ribosomal protein L7/L12